VPICQAGGSPRGQAFASRWADTIITNALTVEVMKKFREDVRKRAVGWGRDPDSIKVLFLAYPIVDTTDEAAHERRRLLAEEDGRHLDLNLSGLSRLTNIDFAQFDLDQPLPAGLTTNGHQSSLTSWIGKTPRELATGNRRQGIELVGSADTVAGKMQEIMQEVGGDGFLIFNTYFDRRYIMEVCDGLVPELQRRKLVRKAYAHQHLRDNLLEF
jgi:alkanesulfonate monooxygenase SsuD/methylene tetrahydromethanopterin reductase-like flavin-dependent oxidoreductase (luciferase family)